MKLQSQLNAAFTALLLVVMTVTGYFIYSLILDMLIQDEQRQLKQKGDLLIEVLNEQYGRPDIQNLNSFLQDQDLQLFLYDRNQNAVFYSTLSNSVATEFFKSNDFADTSKSLWEYKNDKYVTSRILLVPESTGLELILLTPLSDIEVVQQNFIFRLLIVFLIGGVAATIISYFFTRKLVTPLSQLKRQLKKIEKRQFDSMDRINATGEIKEVEQSVYEMANELQRYINSQQTFFQNASHELKTPLMTIQGYAEGIRDKIFDEKEEAKGLEVMVSEVNRLKKIINEMILLAKLDSEPDVYNPEKLQLSQIMEQVVDRALPLVSEKGIELEHAIDGSPELYADGEKLLRALVNLAFNGIRHSKSLVRLTITKQNKKVVIMIEDDGDGVPEELIPHIFHRFVKGKGGETGLGLAIARAIIEQSGGKITVARSELGGAKFKIVFTG
ncbi:MAG: sensor histidine kinase [Bacillota bacterium]|uniref:histidine kinase n=1 Tax=Virgibacillus salarius TaxID=447199 RepID=A0A941I900_9BACI|nr:MULTISPECIES: HAMP domain-containing sensor histidine kinase [Virgibacillus]NAZ08912.1 sensor histidine kinase [Agaribacter marinus]MBR7796204.1 HAMP domain-containing histidine kinase [Virgibacillus salarius]MCC2252599.1 HAMP domain-containing histidine kinase [Virgibacillus sp. AGTR]MDY7046607.1 HAMP domain-containing sensor histidine kinase [Virgibacillus sp. M23]QRZ19638.1 HAMP domain-containing histidine kinase [Virgibacillus sp. AGTR]